MLSEQFPTLRPSRLAVLSEFNVHLDLADVHASVAEHADEVQGFEFTCGVFTVTLRGTGNILEQPNAFVITQGVGVDAKQSGGISQADAGFSFLHVQR